MAGLPNGLSEKALSVQVSHEAAVITVSYAVLLNTSGEQHCC